MLRGLCTFFFIIFSSLYSEEPTTDTFQETETTIASVDEIAAATLMLAKTDLSSDKEGYTINYNTVSIIEYIRFASKICNLNFIFNEADLDFTVTVVSDAPITPQNVMATLLQVLRIHGLRLLEQDKNLVIHKSADVVQIAPLVTDGSQENNFPIVTRVFRLKVAKVDSIAGIIRPMISGSALLEVLSETKQMILTDVTANVDKVASLIQILDSPQNQLDVRTYTAVNNKPEALAALADQIMAPFAGTNPFILVPQPMTGSIFIVSTGDLIDKTLSVLKTLDVAPKKEMVSQQQLKSENIFVYKAMNRSSDDLLHSLQSIGDNLQRSGIPEGDLITTIDSARSIKETNSILFVGSTDAITKIKEFLLSLDMAGAEGVPGKMSYFVYNPKNRSAQEIDSALKEMADNLKHVKGEEDLVKVLHSAKINTTTNTILFSGDESQFGKVRALLSDVDAKTEESTKPVYFIYKLQNASGDVVEEELETIAKDMEKTGAANKDVLNVIHTLRYIKETNSLLLMGNSAAVDEVKEMIVEYDYPRGNATVSSNFFMYKPQYKSAKEIEHSLHDVASNLKAAGLADPSLLQTIDKVKYVETTNSLIFTGNADSIKKIQTLIPEIDIPPKESAQIQHVGKTTFLLYKLKVAGAPQILAALKNMTANLQKTGTADKNLIDTLNSIKYIKETNSLLFTGDEESLQRVQLLIEQFDVTSLAAAPSATTTTVPGAGQANFILYTPVALPPDDLEKLVNDFAENAHASGLNDPELFAAIASMKLAESTHSLIFTGTPKALDQIQQLLKSFDVPANLITKPSPTAPSEPSIQGIDNTSFMVYKLQFHKGDEIQNALKQIAKDLINNNAPINQNLLNSINSIQWLEVTNSILSSGDQETLTRLKELIKNLDIPLKQVFIEVLVVETSLTNALLFGLEWGGNYKFNNRFGISSFNTVPPANPQSPFPDQFVSRLSTLTPPSAPTPIGNIPPVTGFDLGVIGEVIKHKGETFLTLGSLLNALQTDNETTIITAPKLLGQDGRTSTIFSGANIPFTGSFVNNTTNGATILTSNIEYRDIGLNLTITPVLGNSDIVTLDIDLDRSQTASGITQSSLNFQNQSANGIITSKTTMQTTVHVPDRNFLVLSGFVNNSTTKTKQGIPCLGGLPMIGAAFSQQNDTISNQNIVIFLRPFIINSIEDMRRVTSEQEDFFRDQAGTPFLEHNYDDAVELIKTIDDE